MKFNDINDGVYIAPSKIQEFDLEELIILYRDKSGRIGFDVSSRSERFVRILLKNAFLLNTKNRSLNKINLGNDSIKALYCFRKNQKEYAIISFHNVDDKLVCKSIDKDIVESLRINLEFFIVDSLLKLKNSYEYIIVWNITLLEARVFGSDLTSFKKILSDTCSYLECQLKKLKSEQDLPCW